MTTQLLNEPELLLLRQWDEARLLEKSMERVREKYNTLFEQIAEAVTAAHPELDSHRVYVTQFWGQGAIGFGRKAWPDGDNYSNMPGLWLDNLRLEVLSAEAEPQPSASIWMPPRATRKTSLTMQAVRQEVLDAARQLLAQEEYDRYVRPASDGKNVIYFTAPTKRDILDRFATGDGESLVQTVVEQFSVMARFVPVLDRLFDKTD